MAQSGRSGAVTIATNMAGRGTDIILGGNPEFMARLKLREMLMPRVVSQIEGENVLALGSTKKVHAGPTRSLSAVIHSNPSSNGAKSSAALLYMCCICVRLTLFML